MSQTVDEALCLNSNLLGRKTMSDVDMLYFLALRNKFIIPYTGQWNVIS